MRKTFIYILLATLCGASLAQQTTCMASATEKKLAGAAKNSFLKKCEKDATERCEAAAAEKKLFGAAKNSNVNKCVKEAVGELPAG